MTDLHSALKTEIVGTAGWDGGQLVLVRLQHGKDQFSHSLHVCPNSFSFSGIQVPDMLAILGFQRSRCSFVNGGECYAKEVAQSFDVTSFAAIIKPMYDALRQAGGHFQTCGFSLDRPEGSGFFQGQTSRRGRDTGYSMSGDGHTGHKIQRMKESEDTAFKFVFTWLESDRLSSPP
jgi:hypothetical protein